MNLQCNLPIAMPRGWRGLIVFVPHGDAKDPTCSPALYDEIYGVLVSCGIAEI